MARLKHESCIICGNTPCTCDAKPRKVAAPKVKPTATKPAVVEAPRKFKSAPIQAPVTQSRFAGKVETREHDADLEAALRAVRDLVSPRDRGRIDQALAPTMTQDVDRRLSEWKAKHGKA